MKKLVISLSVLLASSAIISCGNANKGGKYPGYNEMETGLHLKSITENASGRAVAVGDIVTLNLSYSLNNDSVIYDSEANGQPIQLRADTGKYVGDFMGIFPGMKMGDSASVIVNAQDFFTKTAGMPQSPEFVDSSDVLYFSVGIANVQTMEELQAEQASKALQAEAAEQTELAAYMAQNYPDAVPTESGMYFISLKEGTGKQAEAGKIVKVHYEGMLLNGTYFDTSVEEVAKAQGLYDERRAPYTPFEFNLGVGQVIQGWDEGIAMLKEGGKARLIIPSKLGYGANPRPGGIIQPYNTLIFDVEMLEVSDVQ